MLDGGLVEFGAHTHTHGRFLGRCDAFRCDLARCLDELRSRFQVEQPAFAFPYGDYGSELIDAALRLGVTCCLTTRHRRVNPGDDPTVLGRFNVECGDSSSVIAGKLSGWRTAVAVAGMRSRQPFAPLSVLAPLPVPHRDRERGCVNSVNPRKAVSSS
jgi:hypothetical protein